MDSSMYVVRSIPLLLCCLLAAVPVQAQVDACGLPVDGTPPTLSSDALYVLNTAVNLQTCALCVCDVDDSGIVAATDALIVLRSAVELPVTLDCPSCDPEGLECPAVAQFALFASIRGPCATNAECAAFSACDTTLGRCRTATESDTGWTGLSHNDDTNDPVPARVFLGCEARRLVATARSPVTTLRSATVAAPPTTASAASPSPDPTRSSAAAASACATSARRCRCPRGTRRVRAQHARRPAGR